MSARLLLLAVLLGSAPGVHAEPSCTREAAIERYKDVYSAAVARIQAEQGPARLQKDKVGLVLVARPARGEIDTEALQADLRSLGASLQGKPEAFCADAERFRRKHQL